MKQNLPVLVPYILRSSGRQVILW